MSGARSRTKGHETERMVARYLKANGWPDACTTRAKLGHDGAAAPGDIDWHPLVTLEVKNVAASAWPSWCRQTVAEAPPGTVPMVVRRTRGVADVGRWECRVKALPWVRAVPSPLTVAEVIGSSSSVLVDGWVWHVSTFAAVASAVAALDKDGTE